MKLELLVGVRPCGVLCNLVGSLDSVQRQQGTIEGFEQRNKIVRFVFQKDSSDF